MKILLASTLLLLGFTPKVLAQELPTELRQLELMGQKEQQPSPQPTRPSQQEFQLYQQQVQPTQDQYQWISEQQEFHRRVQQLEEGLVAKQKENRQIIQWIIWWWWIGFIVGWVWFFVWIFIGWQWWRLKFWVFVWPKPWWFFIPLLWFIPWVFLGISNWLVWWIPWIWFWWIFPWAFWVPWWIIVFKEKEIWLWRLKK